MERPFVIAQAGRLGLLIAVILYTASLRTAAASPPAAIEPFFGRYEGRTIVSGDDGDTTSRDLTVIIQPEGDRFRIEWTTVTRQSDGEIKRKTYSIGFEQTQRPKIFRSAMRTDMFGHHVPLDPLKGDPYVWCRIIGPVLTLYSLQITDIGGYDLQIYERTVEGDRMSLHFRRLHEGEPPKELTATLERVAGATGKGG